jgi:hypothetical protein
MIRLPSAPGVAQSDRWATAAGRIAKINSPMRVFLNMTGENLFREKPTNFNNGKNAQAVGASAINPLYRKR